MWTHAATARERIGLPTKPLDAWNACVPLPQVGDSQEQLDALEGSRGRCADPRSDRASVSAFEAALDLASTLGERRRALAMRNALGILEWERGGMRRRWRTTRRRCALVRDQGDPIAGRRDPEQPRRVADEAAAGRRKRGPCSKRAWRSAAEMGERQLEAHALAALGHVSRTLGRSIGAAECFEQSSSCAAPPAIASAKDGCGVRLAETQDALGNDAAAQAAPTTAAGGGRERRRRG